MSVLEAKHDIAQIKHDIAQLSAAEVEEVMQWLTQFQQEQASTPAMFEDTPEYVGSPAYKEAIKALDAGFKDFEEGRYSSWAEVDARMRAKYNISDDVKPFTPEELEAFEREMDTLP